jgi:8-oxo-dGTP pyrophosphatase MutT (NUDIX family)
MAASPPPIGLAALGTDRAPQAVEDKAQVFPGCGRVGAANGQGSGMSPKKARRVDHWQDPDGPKPTSRKPSASALVRDGEGRVLLLRRPDNGLWTIPTGGLKKGETIRECAARECREETGVVIETLGLVGVFTTPDHVIEYIKGGRVDEVRQPVNVCLHARPVGGVPTTTAEASEVTWVAPDNLPDYDIHPALWRRIQHGLSDGEPHVD